MGSNDNNRRSTARGNAVTDATQRQASPSPRKKLTPQQIASRNKAAQKRKIAIIVACALALLILIGVITGLIVSAIEGKDDGRILSNVVAGGVDLGGMTVDEAKNALHLATDNAFSKKDMLVKLPDSSFTLSPSDTGVRLDVDAVIEAAYNYGRTGTESEQKQVKKDASSVTHTIALLPYLNLDLDYIQETIDAFCDSYSSVMTQPSAVLNGERPAYDPEHPDLPVVHQTLTVTMGTPDYALDSEELYDRVLDAYSLNEMEVSYKAPTRTEPNIPSAKALFEEHCTAPSDAAIDGVTFEVTPEVYGYGFDVDALQKQISNADYGDVIEVTLDFILPRVTAKELTEGLFVDVLAEYTCNGSSSSSNRNTNLQVSCETLNDFVVKAGEEFSFNQVLGRLTAEKGYKKATIFHKGEQVDILGGGVNQTASALYYCALMADLEILERHNHDYAVSFSEPGLDASVEWGSQDLRLRNNTSSPIRIVASSANGDVTIRLFGVDERDYRVEISSKTIATNKPQTTYKVVAKDNVLGYKDGDVLQTGIIGYDVETYMSKFSKETGELISETLIGTTHYEKRDEIVVRFYTESPVEPTEPTEPVDPTDPVDPTEPTEPVDPTDPVEPTEPTDPGPIDEIIDFIGGLL